MKRVLYIALALTVGFLTSDVFAQGTATQQEGRGSAQGRQEGGRPGGPRGGADKKDAAPAAPVPVKLTDGAVALSPANTKVNFVGIHVGDDPKPRLGGFKKFTGELKMADDAVKSLTMEFETTSLWTQIDGLTTHLKNADFLDVEKFPSAKFVSTSVAAGEDGKVNIVGDFTLMGKTNEITIPVEVKKQEAGVLVKGDLKLDRVAFGMDKMVDRVAKEVSITVSVGEKTTGGAPAAGGGRGEGRGRGGRGGFDPAAFFKEADKDGDGKLSGDEIPERMKQGIDRMDTDKDGAISLEEMQEMMKRFQGGGNRGGGNRGGGNRGGGNRDGGDRS